MFFSPARTTLTDLIVSIYSYPSSLNQFTLKLSTNLHRHTVDDLNGMGVVTYYSRGADYMVSYLGLTLCVCVTLVLRGSYRLGSLDYIADGGLDSSYTGGKVGYVMAQTAVG